MVLLLVGMLSNILPLKGVANNLVIYGGITDVPIIIAALLHDTVEDTKTTFEEIEHEFGKDVSHMVSEVTDDKSLAKGRAL